jgi:hypothetical protein
MNKPRDKLGRFIKYKEEVLPKTIIKPRDKHGHFINYNPKAKRFTNAQLKSAFQAGMNGAYSTVTMSPSRRFEIWCKQNGIEL